MLAANFDLRTWGRSGAEARSNGGGVGLPELGRPQRGCFFVTAVISSRAQRTVLDSEAVTLQYNILASSAGACARRFLVTDAARLVPAPHLRDENLIEGAGASILEQRNGRGTAEEQQLSLLIISES